jgi:hypothetical protein
MSSRISSTPWGGAARAQAARADAATLGGS